MMSGEQPPTVGEIAEYEAKLAEYSALIHNTRLDQFMEWGASLIFAAIVLAGWFLFNSITLGFLMAIPCTALIVWGLLAINRKRIRLSHEWLKANAHKFQQEKD
ncbi:hypothetical protein K1X45_04615 [Pseudochrobactrum sp. Wa41.01b-1]|uniref:hypothetical protein n=1 Tax=Pseudochrobactrum sp. Wa41.01b-1 TaxID=2864102 RepID=UPI001C6904E0|nr:hypothetical protein [Pseudochrobactrum sp. Wa41.01b-1]QYM73706.1 hypothetical protein K1X45_04615 [Pseudochrobactrum sp. Wa41.01b-1]